MWQPDWLRSNPRRRPARTSTRRHWTGEKLEDRRLMAFAGAVDYAVGVYPQSVATGDFNGDGLFDLAAANYNSSSVSVLLNTGNGAFAPAVQASGGDTPISLVAGDFDGDGKLDLATVSGRYDYSYYPFARGAVSVMYGNGNGSFQLPSKFTTGAYTKPHSLAVGDFNADGRMDLAVANTYGYYGFGQTSVMLGNGNRTLSQPIVALELASDGFSVAAADLNNDGRQDLITGSYGIVQIGLGDGAGNFDNASGANWLLDHGRSIASGDLNGDGKFDLITADGIDVNVRLGDGLGGLQAPPGGQSFPAGDSPISLALGDFNRDGNLDVATANVTGGYVTVLLGKGDGGFGTSVVIDVGQGPVSIAARDFNGDGWVDLATANANSNSVSVLLNDQSWTNLPPPVSISVSDASITEGKRGLKYLNFTVTLSGASTAPVTVRYATQNGTATAGSDYQSQSDILLTFTPGQISKIVSIAIYGDTAVEPNETLQLILSSPTGYAVISDGTGIGTIINDDAARGRKNSRSLSTEELAWFITTPDEDLTKKKR